MNIQIKNAKIKNSLFLEYGYSERINNAENQIKTSSDAPIHEDLANAFRMLVPHFAGICEEVDNEIVVNAIDSKTDLSYLENSEENENLLKYYAVKGFLIGGSGDDEGVTISGNKQLQSGKIINLTTPFTKFSDFENYSYCTELKKAVDHLKNEVYDYLEGKQAPPKQQAMEFPDAKEENFENPEM